MNYNLYAYSVSFLLSFVYCARERVPRNESEYDLIYASEKGLKLIL